MCTCTIADLSGLSTDQVCLQHLMIQTMTSTSYRRTAFAISHLKPQWNSQNTAAQVLACYVSVACQLSEFNTKRLFFTHQMLFPSPYSSTGVRVPAACGPCSAACRLCECMCCRGVHGSDTSAAPVLTLQARFPSLVLLMISPSLQDCKLSCLPFGTPWPPGSSSQATHTCALG
jgi:hypothetical protein